MDLPSFRDLLSPLGQEALRAAVDLQSREEDFLRDFTILSRRFPAHLSRVALETAILRSKAADKFPQADRQYFTREALEQASPWEVARYRSQRYQPFAHLADLGCSVGGDTLALGSIAPTIGVDVDPLRLQMACVNAEVSELVGRVSFVQADLTSPLPFSTSSGLALFFDPSRRKEGKRVYSVHNYRPPLGVIQVWLEYFPALGVKVSPGVNLSQLGSYDAEIEFISLRGELKEAVLWFGPLKTVHRRATILPGQYFITGEGFIQPAGEAAHARSNLPLSTPRSFIYEPDPAILRAGLVADLGIQISACQLDPQIAYLTADEFVPTPFANAWEIEDWFPFGLKRLRSYLRERQIGRVTVKKRGSPLQPEALIQDLRLKGDGERIVFLTQLEGRPIVVVCSTNRAPINFQ